MYGIESLKFPGNDVGDNEVNVLIGGLTNNDFLIKLDIGSNRSITFTGWEALVSFL